MPLFHSGNKMSRAILLIILLVSILLFISGLLVLVLKLLKKRRLSSILQSTSRNYDISSTSNALQRQLHQLFNVYDSGLDQSLIDVLPMFIYKDVCGLDGPFDCPVCLCEFSHEDKLRLLPLCKHAFHLDCIDTWLLSNSTCPLCRGTHFAPENPSFGLDDDDDDDGFSNADEIVAEKRVFSLRLGKFKHMNQDIEMGETSNINLDGRRCFSMGSVQYVVSDKEFQVALCPNRGAKRNDDDDDDDDDEKGGNEVVEFNNNNQKVLNNDGKKISNGSKRESFSISKVWLWPKKSKIPDEGDNHFSKQVNVCLPSSTRDTIQSTMKREALCTCKIIHENLDPKYCKCSFSQLNHTKDENLNLV